METLNSVEKALVVLNQLRRPPFSFNLTEVASILQITKPGALKILNTLEKSGFVVKNTRTKHYSLGPSLFRLGNVYQETKGITEIAQPVLRSLAEMAQGTAYVTLWEQSEAFIILKEENPNDYLYSLKTLQLNQVFGDSIPIHCGASAKLLAAFQNPREVEKILEAQGLPKCGPNTILSKESLFEEYRKIREQGYAISDEEYDTGLVALSVPLFDEANRAVIALSLACHKIRMPLDGMMEFLPVLRSSARQMERKLSLRS